MFFKKSNKTNFLPRMTNWVKYIRLGFFAALFFLTAAVWADSTVRLVLRPTEETAAEATETTTAESKPTEASPAAESRTPAPPATEESGQGDSATALERAAVGETELLGRLVVDYRSGGGAGFVVIEQNDGHLRTIPEKRILQIEKLDEEFKYLTPKAFAERLLTEAGPAFRSLAGKHFLIIYNTSDAYATWCSKLFESLYDGFDKYQLRRDYNLREPELPMPVLLFSNREQFADYAGRDMPDSTGIAAYYNRVTNRVVLYDLSEEETGRSAQRRQKPTWQQIDEFLSRPQAAFNVATMIHEATHQIAFNRKMFLRTGPYPLWLAEGLSMFFETPDAGASHGWSRRTSASRPNTLRLSQLRQYIARAPADPIRDIIREERFMERLVDSYAMSWGLFYYLNNKEPKKLAEYIVLISKKTPYAVYSPQERLADFESVFGDDWDKFHKSFGKFLDGVR